MIIKILIRFSLLLALFVFSNVFAQNNFPKREMRAAWIPSIYNLDWPTSRTANTESQKNELLKIFDELQETGINAVFLQIRTECDALYDSEFEPWSYWLTGKQGKAPEPFYDPLQFACEETQKRNIELHAWINPYRAQASIGSYSIDPNHISLTKPEWIIKIGSFKFLNPGLPQVRSYLKNIVADIVSRYNISGIHFDDYFYPYPPNNITDEDIETFSNNSRNFFNIDDWRRDNINLLVKAVHDTINEIKPWVKFGISPFGIWKNNVPSGIVGTSSYEAIYCDPISWLEDNYVDYVSPQLYWEIGGNQDYSKLMQWWGTNSNNRHIYTGHAVYKMTNSNNWANQEILDQIELNRNENNVSGSVFYRTSFLINNTKSIKDSLGESIFKYHSLLPAMTWKDSIPPNNPQNLTASFSDLGIELNWDLPETASDGEISNKHVVYKFPEGEEIDINNPKYILDILDGNTTNFIDNDLENNNYLVTSLDRLSNESEPSNLVSSAVTDVQSTEMLVSGFSLEQNYPNPFNPTTIIKYSTPSRYYESSSFVTLIVYDILGEKVSTLVNQHQPPGEHEIEFNAENLPSGTYFYQLRVKDLIATKKMVIIK